MADDHAVAVLQRHLLTDSRCRTRKLGIQRVLVLQATHQSAAGARDLEWIRRQILHLGHPQADRLEVLQERGAAQVAAAVAQPADQPRGVSRADLPQVDPRVQVRASSLTNARKSTRWGAVK